MSEQSDSSAATEYFLQKRKSIEKSQKIRVGKDLCAHRGQVPGAAVELFPAVKGLMFCPLTF